MQQQCRGCRKRGLVVAAIGMMSLLHFLAGRNSRPRLFLVDVWGTVVAYMYIHTCVEESRSFVDRYMV